MMLPTIIIWGALAFTVWHYLQEGGEYNAGKVGFLAGIAIAHTLFVLKNKMKN